MGNRTYDCNRCNGTMRIDDYENGDLYSDDGQMPCPTCEGLGDMPYPFNEGDDYWTIEENASNTALEVDDDPDRDYYRSEAEANNALVPFDEDHHLSVYHGVDNNQ